jgi:hypothetical protein
MVEREVSFRADERLDRCESKGAAITWPIPLDNFLDRLVSLADDAGQTTSRKELAAAIVLQAPRDGDALAALITTYRKAKVADACQRPANDENVIAFRVTRPGPRSRTSSA